MPRFDRVRRSAACTILPLAILGCTEGHAPVAPDPLPEVAEITLTVAVHPEAEAVEPSGPVAIENGNFATVYPRAQDAEGSDVTVSVRDELTFFSSDSRIAELEVHSFFFAPYLIVSARSVGEARITVRHSRAGRGVQASVDFVVSPRPIAQSRPD